MVKKETFVALCENVKRTMELTNAFNDGLDKVLRMEFDPMYTTDGYTMCLWPLEAAQEMLINVIKDDLDTNDGADWFVYEAFEKIASGSSVELKLLDRTDADKVVEGAKVIISSFEDYYEFCVSLKEKK